jgi:hypothetical protein
MKAFKVYVGYDPRDELAFRACVASLLQHASIPVEIIPIKDFELRRMKVFWRGFTMQRDGQRIDDRDGKPFSTEFSFTRFAVPLIAKDEDLVLFCDADMLWLSDIADLIAKADPTKAVMCVQHDYLPPEDTKFDGMRQELYKRKNWSSVMLIRPKLTTITPYMLNNQTGSYLHGLFWQDDCTIGALPESWNWLEGWTSPDVKPDIVHFTRGTPDMLGNDLPFSAEWWDAVNKWQPSMNRNGIND